MENVQEFMKIIGIKKKMTFFIFLLHFSHQKADGKQMVVLKMCKLCVIVFELKNKIENKYHHRKQHPQISTKHFFPVCFERVETTR